VSYTVAILRFREMARSIWASDRIVDVHQAKGEST